VAAGVAEIVYVSTVAADDGYSVWRFWPWPLVTVLLAALVVVSARRHRSDPSAERPSALAE
jgi:cytochrome c-type biogenesis protein CcmH/NrfF